MGIQYHPHPDSERAQRRATPDVVVYRTGQHPWMVVLDAKYVGKGLIEKDAARLHEKYARMTANGVSVVRDVIAVHPHQGVTARWAGYGHLGLCPGKALPHLPIPAATAVVKAQALVASPAGEPAPDRKPTDALPVAVIVDQGWMHDAIATSRFDFRVFAEVLAGGRKVTSRIVVMPKIAALQGFRSVLERIGWTFDIVEGWGRGATTDRLLELLRQRSATEAVLVVSGDETLRAAADDLGLTVEFETNLDKVPLLRGR